MERVLIARREEFEVDRQTFDKAVMYEHPFSTLPLLKSHLHPKFVIFDAGSKVTMLLEQRSEFLELYPGLGKIYRLYLAWVQPVPKIAQKDKSYRDLNDVLTADSNDEDRSYHDGHSNRTRSGRGDGFSLRPRTRGVAAGRDGDGSDNFDGGYDSCAEDRLHPSARKASKRKVLSLSESSNHNQSFLSEATFV